MAPWFPPAYPPHSARPLCESLPVTGESSCLKGKSVTPTTSVTKRTRAKNDDKIAPRKASAIDALISVSPPPHHAAVATPPRFLLNIPEACHELHLSRATLFRFLARGDIGSIKVGRRRLVPIRDIEAYITRQREKGGLV